MTDDSKDSSSASEEAEKSPAADSSKPEPSTESGDQITVGNISGSTGVAIGAGASASVSSSDPKSEKTDPPADKPDKPAETKADQASKADTPEKESPKEKKADSQPAPDKEKAAAASDADGGDQITTGDISGSQAVAVGRGATAVVNNFFQSVTGPLRKGPKWLVNMLEWLDSSAILQVLSFVIIVAIPTGAAYVTLIQPLVAPCEPMTGDWNVAVMQFTPTGDQPISRKDADEISRRFANRIGAELEELGSSNQMDITPAAAIPEPVRCRTIRGDTPEERAERAETMAAKLDAQVVVYGTVVLEGGSYQVQPEFFIAIDNRYETEEMVGSHAFGQPIALSGSRDNISSEISLNTLLGDRAQALAWITRGLSLYFEHNYDDALAFFEQANQNQLWTSSEGREVLYLFQGNAAVRAERVDRAKEAYLLALEREPEYARGYAGLASAYYLEALQAGGNSFNPDLDLLDEAERNFEKALEAEVSPPTADVDVKARFGLGQVYLVRWLLGDQDAEAQATEEFQWVLDQYSSGDEILNPRIREFAAESHARLALMDVQEGRTDEAIAEYNNAIELSSIAARRALYWRTLGNLYASEDRPEDAEQARRNAILQFEAAVPLTSQLVQRADYRASIAELYEALDEINDARNAWRDAAELAEEAISTADEEDLRGFPEAERAHARLAEIAVDQETYELAISDYEAAIEFALDEVDRAGYYVALADVYLEVNDDEQALTVLEQALDDLEDEGAQGIINEKLAELQD